MARKQNVNFEHYNYVLSMLGECTDDYIYIFDAVNNTAVVSGNLLETFGYEEEKFEDAMSVFRELIHPDDFAYVFEDIQRTLMHQQDVHDCEYRCRDKNGQYHWICCKGKVVAGDKGEEYLVGQMKEIGIPNKIDNVTDLYRKNVFHEKFEELAGKKEQGGFILILGIDDLKKINERFGYQKGNAALKCMAESAKSSVLPGTEVYRMDGDEVAVYVHGSRFPYTEDQLEQTIRKNIEKNIEEEQYNMYFTISSGVMKINPEMSVWEHVMERLEFSLQVARNSGKASRYDFKEIEFKKSLERERIMDSLRKAVNDDCRGFKLYYQPIMDAETERIRGAEALLRWDSPEFGFMMPGDFIPLLEESGLMIPLGKWIIETAAAQCNEWKEYVPGVVMNINVSYVQLKNSEIVADIRDCFSGLKVDSSNICMEITESGELESNTAIRDKLQELSESGIELAIDDFGSGYSNLRYLKDMDVDLIKMDRLFLRDLKKDTYEYLLLQHITKLAHSMGMDICYEGIETPEELETAKELGPDHLQGFIFGKPMPAEEFRNRFLKDIMNDAKTCDMKKANIG
ncbi:MAG: GGDEF and EAL domain-containing protein [Eubacteriaceae bacterium]|nr:GGDEF and EAL domain-containing protein [Eubacteriaceae bacterium]